MGVASNGWTATVQAVLYLRRLSLLESKSVTSSARIYPPSLQRFHIHTIVRAPRLGEFPANHARVSKNHGERENFYRPLETFYGEAEDRSHSGTSSAEKMLRQNCLNPSSFTAQQSLVASEIMEEYDDSNLEPLDTNDMQGWIDYLLIQQRLYGLDGVTTVWSKMRMRGVDLPTSGEHADILWDILVTAEPVHQEKELLLSVWAHALQLKARTGSHYDGLYRLIVGRSFRINPFGAKRWHSKLVAQGLAPPDALKQVAAHAMLGPRSAFFAFSTMYEASEERNLYDSCIIHALNRREQVQVLHWHRLFTRNGDHPSQELSARPELQRLFDTNIAKSLQSETTSDNTTPRADSDSQSAVRYLSLTRSALNTIVGDVHGIQPKDISDNFCAKMFATRALSINLVSRALAFLGVVRLGPLAVREMALRAETVSNFRNALADLKHYNISLGESVFGKLVLKLIEEGQHDLWEALLTSDVHPEAYEEAKALETVLLTFLEQQKHFQVHVILLALHLAGTDGSTRAWNAILQHYALSHNYPLMLSCLQAVQSQRVQLVRRTLTFLHLHALPPRRPGKGEALSLAPSWFKPVDFVTQAYMYAASSGTFVHWQLWREQLKRYGRQHQWEKLERLVMWLLSHYQLSVSPFEPHSSLSFPERKAKFLQASLLGLLFRKQMQQAIVVWGFRSASIRKQLQPQAARQSASKSPRNKGDLSEQVRICEPWARGLGLVLKLRQSGIWLDMHGIRRSFILRMWILFGPGVSQSPLNNEARRVNRLSLAHYIKHANEIYNGLIYWVPPELLEEGGANNSQLLVAFFGKAMRVNRKEWEYADVEAWSDWLKKSNRAFLHDGYGFHDRKRRWQNSKFRIIRQRRTRNSEMELNSNDTKGVEEQRIFES